MKNFIFSFVLLIIQGCAIGPNYTVYVDSISSPDASNKKSYLILPSVDGVEANDLQYKEYENYVDRALAARGFVKTTDFNKADLAIFLGYGIGDPKTYQYSYSIPTWGQTGVSSSTTTGTINSYGNSSTYTGTTTYTPSYGITGSTNYTGTRTSYFRYMVINAFDLDVYRKNKEMINIWKTTVTSSGSSGDLRQVFPVLVGASKELIATNTGRRVGISIQGNDDRVLEVMGVKK